MDFFVYSRDAAGTTLRRDKELLEEHWSYMDAFAESMIARGPTLAADRETATGSLHVLGLPSVDAAREFVAREPNNRAGVYADHFIWRFENLLGRTMWEFSGAADEPRFLVIARLDRAWGARTPASCCGEFVFVNQTAEQIASVYLTRVRRRDVCDSRAVARVGRF
jgi:uncharacterized protein YciI